MQLLLRALALIVALAVCHSSDALNVRPGIPEGTIAVTLETVVQYSPDPATEFTPIDVEPFNDGTGRLAVSTISGTIRVINGNDQFVTQPLLTKTQSGSLAGTPVGNAEAGMTALAFHPDFNHVGNFGYGKLYTITTERRESQGGLPNSDSDFPWTNENHQIVIREWNLAAFGNVPGNAANGQFTGTLANSREVLRVDRPGPFHSMTDLGFNTHSIPGDADYGHLYITSGDGGNFSGYNRFASAQDLSTIYGNVLRINPDPNAHPLQRTSANTGQPAYSIPPTNPYTNDNSPETKTSSTLAEIFAYGVRSPYRLTFDRDTGKMYLGDVGENAREEVDLIESGKNYGWGHVEGTLDVPESLNQMPGDGTHIPGLTPPLIELTSTDSNSVIGGFVYRGSAIPALRGKYVFGDLGQGFATSALFYAIIDTEDPAGEVGDVFEFQLSPDSDTFINASSQSIPLPTRMFAFGEDETGEIYFTAGPDPRNPPSGLPSYIVRLSSFGTFNGIVGDVDQDGVVEADEDVTAFVAGWKTVGHVGAYAQYTHGDLNFDGKTNLLDVHILRGALSALGVEFSLAALGEEVPEPASAMLGISALVLLASCKRVMRVSRNRPDGRAEGR